MFAFLSTGMMGLWFYIVPRLTGRRLWSEALGNLVLGSGRWRARRCRAHRYAHTQSREYAELVWGVDIAVMMALPSIW